MAVLAPRRPFARMSLVPHLSPLAAWTVIVLLVVAAWLGGWLLPAF
jgi:hypothetical protein